MIERRGKVSVAAIVVPAFLSLVLVACSQYSLYGMLESGASSVASTTSGGSTSSSSLTIQPLAAAVGVSGSYTFLAQGGTSPYYFSVSPIGGAGGTINASTGAYTAPSAAGSAVVTVTDAIGTTSSASVTIVPPPELFISPSAVTLVASSATSSSTFQFSASGGVSPYAYSVVSGNGKMSTTTLGLYTAPQVTVAETDDVRVTDANGSTADATVSVVPLSGSLVLSPQNISLPQNGSVAFQAFNGTTPYVFSAVTGNVNKNNGAYLVKGGLGVNSDTVTVTDAASATASTYVTVLPAAPSGLTATALANGTIQLGWTNNSTGATGVYVEQAAGPSGGFSQVASLSATSTFYTTGTLTGGTAYRFRVRAYYTSGTTTLYSAYSNQAFALAP